MATERDTQTPVCRKYQGERIRVSENLTITLTANCDNCRYKRAEEAKVRAKRLRKSRRVRRWNGRIDAILDWYHAHQKKFRKALTNIGGGAMALGFVLVFVWMLFFAEDGTTASAAPEQTKKAINGDYYYSESDYNQYLEERQAYLDAEAAEWESIYKYMDTED